MSAKPVILLDCDGPLAAFGTAYLDALYEETGKRFTEADIDRWAIHECPWFAELSARDPGLKRRVDEWVSRPGFCAEIPVQDGALDAVARLAKLGEVWVVTSPWSSSQTWMHERTKWVERHFPMIPKGHVIHASKKHLIYGNVFVDDKLSHVEEWVDHWRSVEHYDAHGFVYGMAHNGATSGWSDVINHVRMWRGCV